MRRGADAGIAAWLGGIPTEGSKRTALKGKLGPTCTLPGRAAAGQHAGAIRKPGLDIAIHCPTSAPMCKVGPFLGTGAATSSNFRLFTSLWKPMPFPLAGQQFAPGRGASAWLRTVQHVCESSDSHARKRNGPFATAGRMIACPGCLLEGLPQEGNTVHTCHNDACAPPCPRLAGKVRQVSRVAIQRDAPPLRSVPSRTGGLGRGALMRRHCLFGTSGT